MKFAFWYFVGALATAAAIIVWLRVNDRPLTGDDIPGFGYAVVMWPLTLIVVLIGLIGLAAVYLSGGTL